MVLDRARLQNLRGPIWVVLYCMGRERRGIYSTVAVFPGLHILYCRKYLLAISLKRSIAKSYGRTESQQARWRWYVDAMLKIKVQNGVCCVIQCITHMAMVRAWSGAHMRLRRGEGRVDARPNARTCNVIVHIHAFMVAYGDLPASHRVSVP